MRAAFDLDFALGKRVSIGLAEIDALEFRALKVIEVERRLLRLTRPLFVSRIYFACSMVVVMRSPTLR
jgi:hypothetical protein